MRFQTRNAQVRQKNAPGFFTNPAIRAAYLGSEWLGPSQGQLDPVKEITAEILACSEGYSTHEPSTIRLNGGQWDNEMEETADAKKRKGPEGSGAGQNWTKGFRGCDDLDSI